MTAERKLVFFLHHYNDLDQIAPVIYKIGHSMEIPIDVVLDQTTSIGHETHLTESDYRVKLIQSVDSVSVYTLDDIFETVADSSEKVERSLVELVKDLDLLKEVGRLLPTDIPNKVYNSAVSQATKDRDSQILDFLTDGYDDVVVAGDWTIAKNPSLHVFESAAERDFATVVLPHGDSPYQNDIKKQSYFDDVLEAGTIFSDSSTWFQVAYKSYERMDVGDHFVMPNEKTARRLNPLVDADRVSVLGSPRYNPEWLNVLSDIRPEYSPSVDADLNVVLFARNKRYFINEQEVYNTIRLVTGFSDVHLIFKEHPREGQILNEDDNDVTDISNLTVIQDEVDSVALIAWGDVFLEMGTSIVFEPIMRDQPVLSLDYTHANYSTVSHYLSASDVRSKDDLYYVLHSLLDEGCEDFYDESERATFIAEMITNGHEDVLDGYVEIFKACF